MRGPVRDALAWLSAVGLLQRFAPVCMKTFALYNSRLCIAIRVLCEQVCEQHRQLDCYKLMTEKSSGREVHEWHITILASGTCALRACRVSVQPLPSNGGLRGQAGVRSYLEKYKACARRMTILRMVSCRSQGAPSDRTTNQSPILREVRFCPFSGGFGGYSVIFGVG